MKRHLFFAASILLLAGAVSACGDSGTGTSGTPEDTADNLSVQENTETEPLLYGLPEQDFGGAEYHILYCENFFFSPYDVEQETGEVLDDAAFRRNRNVEEHFNCDVIYDILPNCSGDESAQAVRKAVSAGDDLYEIAIVHPYGGLNGLISEGYTLDWNTIPRVNFEQPWWNHSFNTALAIGGHLFCASSDFIYFNSGCIYFNKELLNELDLENPYQLVDDGTWTWDKLRELSEKAGQDLNGNGKKDAEDRYGYSIIKNHRMVPVTYSYGIMSTTLDTDGYPVYSNIGSEKMHDAVENYYHLLYDSPSAWLCNDNELDLFRNGQVLFLHYVTQNIKALRDLPFDFGILPQPKGSAEQEEYYSLAQSNVMVIPATAEDTEFVGTIIEALSAESCMNVLPALYDTTFNNKYLRDEDSIRMFDIIKNSLVYDTIWNYLNGGSFVYFLPTLIGSKSYDTASFYEKNHKAAETAIREFYDQTLERA